ncbi:MAG: AI-2E family transporter [Acidimicrobiia bacterium]
MTTSEQTMPKWVIKAIIIFFVAQLIYQFTFSALVSLRGFLLTVLVSLFLSFAIEPAVNSLAKRGMRRGPATALVFLILIIIASIFMFAIASLVVDQVAKLSDNSPKYVEQVQNFLNDRFHTKINTDSLREQLANSDSPIRKALNNLAGNVIDIGTSAIGIIFQLLTIALFTFYFVADAPKLRRSLLRRLPPERQAIVLNTWELAIEKTGGYIYSRALLALISGFFHWMFFETIGVPYAVALGVWVGIVSQFIPVIGTYLAGVLPIGIALIQEPKLALFSLIFVVIYQQIENYLFAPRITAKTMDMHPAVAFASVIIGGTIFGPVGALLSLPAAAMIQAFATLYLQEHAVIDSPMTAEPETKRKKN